MATPRRPLRVLFLVGPTASGKSELAVALARKTRGEVLSADSMLVYRGMDIGTAKPTAKERRGVPHHGIDLIPQSKSFSVFHYRQFALKTIRQVLRKGKVPVVAGGTGFYVRALLEGLTPQPAADPAVRGRLEEEAKEKGTAVLYERLRKIDPERAQAIGPHNLRRIVRALEIHEVSGEKPAAQKRKSPGLCELGFDPVVIGIHRDRAALYARIDARVERMFRKGLVREVKRSMRKKISPTALQGVGYKEVVEQLLRDPGTADWTEVKRRIQQTTRHFAKRQWTWFKREPGIRWIWWPEGVSTSKVRDFIISKFLKNG